MNISIKQRLGIVLGGLMLAVATVVVPVVPQNAAAAPVTASDCTANETFVAKVGSTPAKCVAKQTAQGGIGSAKGDGVPTELFGQGSIFTTIVNTLLFVIGAVSVIMLIWGGIRYTTSAGNSSAVTSAKNTIMYAIIGLIIAFLAYAIINWVLGAINPGA